MKAKIAMFLLGYLCSILYTSYILAVDAHSPVLATGIDFMLLFAGALSLQIWQNEDKSFRLLVIEALGSAIGTYITVAGS